MKWADGRRAAGYTILETIIFLAVSSAMFISAMTLVSGKQQRTEFSSAVRDFEASLNDIANDVSNGYYANTAGGSTIGCSASASSVDLYKSGTDRQGSNIGCIFIGRAIHFAPAGSDKLMYDVFTMTGRQFIGANPRNGDVQTYAQSGVKAAAAISASDTTTPNAVISSRLGGGVTAECALYATTVIDASTITNPCSSGQFVKTDIVAFMTKFHTDFGGSLETGSSSPVNIVVPASPSNVGRTSYAAATTINSFTDAAGITNIVLNPAGGAYVCLQSNGSNQYSMVAIGGSSSRSTADVKILDGRCG